MGVWACRGKDLWYRLPLDNKSDTFYRSYGSGRRNAPVASHRHARTPIRRHVYHRFFALPLPAPVLWPRPLAFAYFTGRFLGSILAIPVPFFSSSI